MVDIDDAARRSPSQVRARDLTRVHVIRTTTPEGQILVLRCRRGAWRLRIEDAYGRLRRRYV